MITKEDFTWKIARINNITTNPIEEYYCIIRDITSDFARKYSVSFHFPVLKDNSGLYYTKSSADLDYCIKNARYFVINEVTGRKMTHHEVETTKDMYKNGKHTPNYYNNIYGPYSGYEFNNKTEGIILDTFEDAKDYLFTMNFNFMHRYVNAYISKDKGEYKNSLNKWICDTEGNFDKEGYVAIVQN